jgi:hypothetical protein
MVTPKIRAAASASAARSAALPRVPDSPLRQIQNSGAETACCHAEEGSAAGLFDIIAMGCDGQHIHCRRVRTSGHVAPWLRLVDGVVGVGDGVHVGHVVGRSGHGDVEVVDRRAVRGRVDIDLAALGDVELVQAGDGGDSGQIALDKAQAW